MNPQSVEEVAKRVTSLAKDEYIAMPISRSEDQPTPVATAQHQQLGQFGKTTYQYREFVCGWGAAFINITVTFPMNKVKYKP